MHYLLYFTRERTTAAHRKPESEAARIYLSPQHHSLSSDKHHESTKYAI